jgi:TP901 family phage tail tape measure protein
MSVDVTSLVIKVSSQGIDQAANSLTKLTQAANAAEKVGVKVENSTKRVAQAQKESSSAIDTLMAKFQKQADLLGANTAQTNAYQASMKNATAVEREMAAMLGAEVDAYKRLSASQVEAYRQKQTMQKRDIELQSQAARTYASAQSEAIRINAALDASYKRAAASASILARQQAAANAKGQALNQAGFRAEEYKKLSQAQSEALRMNAALDASNKRLEMDRLAAIQMDKARSYKILSDAQAEAIRMNNALDASQKRLAADTHRQQQIRNANAMKEASGAARGLSGSLGALWLTYGNFAGMAVGLGIGVALKGIVMVGKDVEHTLEGIRVRGEESIKSIDAMRDSLLNLGKGVYGPKEVANAFEILTLAGLRADQSLLAINDALNLATVGGTTIAKAAEALVGTGTALGYTAEGYSRVADVISKTAAVSIASVESISETFKQASAVGKLYGVTLVDLGVQTAALSNLLVRGSAAGTAIKNFYSVLSNESDKVTRGLKMLNLTISDLRTPDGQFRSFTEIMLKLRGGLNVVDGETVKVTSGFNSLSAAAQKTAQRLLTNERSNRLFTESLSLVRQEGVQTGTALEDMVKKIDESYGYAALGAAAMALTINSQLKSVKNTLDVSLVKAFQEVQPQISLVATALRNAFSSSEFNSGVKSLASAVADFTVFLVDNANTIWNVVRALLAFKAAMMLFGLLTTVAGGIVTITTAVREMTLALGLARGAAIAFQLSLGLVGIALVAGAALFTLWATAKSEATTSDQARASLNYLDDFKGKLDEESKRMRIQIGLMKEGKTANEAYTQSLRDQQLEVVRKQSTDAVIAQQKLLDAAKQELAAKPELPQFGRGDKLTFVPNSAAIKKVADAQEAFNRVAKESREKVKGVTDSMNEQVSAAKELANLSDAAAKKTREIPTGDGEAPIKDDKARSNDMYSARLKSIEGEIEAGKRGLAMIESSANSKYKAGLISEFDQIDAISKARVEKLTKDVSLYQKMLDTAAPKNRNAVQAAIGNKQAAAEDLLDQEKQRRQEEYSVALARMQDENYNNHYKQLVLQGRNEEAAVEKSKRLYENKIKTEEQTLVASLQDMMTATGPQADELKVKVDALAQHLAAMKGEAAALTSKGKMDDTELATQKMLESVRTQIVGINAAVPKGGLFAGIAADKSIAAIRENAIPELERLYAIQKKLAESPDAAPDAMKNLAKTGEELQKLREKSGGVDAWTGAQESIRKYAASATDAGTLIGDAMTNAFKGAEDALTTFIMTGKINFRSLASSIVADLARIQAKQMLMSISGGDSGGGGIFGSLLKMGISSLAGAFGGAAMGTFGVSAGVLPTTNASVNGNLDWMSGIKGFADGGSPPLGQISMVGEEGPELFVPKSAGTIIPNHALQGPMQNGSNGSSDQPTNYTIVNQTTGRIDEVKEQRLNGNERALIIKETLSAVASSLYDANSNVSKGIKNNHNIQRVR